MHLTLDPVTVGPCAHIYRMRSILLLCALIPPVWTLIQ
jgi:hypothetical protein